MYLGMGEGTVVPVLSNFCHFSMLLQFILKEYRQNIKTTK
jgi:hypothetical protein